MEIQKEREAFEVWLRSYIKANPDFWDMEDHEKDSMFDAWQAAKAQAVPEGFVLVKQVHPDSIVHNQGLGLFKECQVIYGWNGKSKEFKDALNKGFYHGVKLGAKAVLETAMIEAQEPTNE
ncbi:hypothetical protein [Acinetobacter radioresistens]|uniref:hypothetical protein n=1 Tax=Acinetobacter radioresistens TaxID=40216 RepID=UPI00200586B1|nr:hypothetical protein [Acinetobacter radioresistens]